MADETTTKAPAAPKPAETRKAAPADVPFEQTRINEEGKRVKNPDAGGATGAGFLYDSGLGSDGPADRESDKFDPAGGGPKPVTQEDVLEAQKKDAAAAK